MSLSPELNLREIRQISNSIGGNLESVVYGYLPSMIIKSCPLALLKGCNDDKSCEECNFRIGYGLRDRMEMTFPLVRNNGYSTLYNSLPVMVLDSLNQIYEAGVSFGRIDFTIEKNNIDKIQEYFYDYAKGHIADEEVEVIVEDFKKDVKITKGHYYRGVL